MKILLDTHVFLLWQMQASQLDNRARLLISEAEQVYVRAISAAEIAIEVSIGKLRAPASVAWAVEATEFDELPVGFAHVERLRTLPYHHRDPFDRILVVQAQHEALALVTHDARLSAYDVPVIAV